MRSAAALATLALAMVHADDPAGPQCGVTARGVTVFGGKWASITDGQYCLWELGVVDYAVCTRWPFYRETECVDCQLDLYGFHFLCNVKSDADLALERALAFAAAATAAITEKIGDAKKASCLLYTSPSPRDS